MEQENFLQSAYFIHHLDTSRPQNLAGETAYGAFFSSNIFKSGYYVLAFPPTQTRKKWALLTYFLLTSDLKKSWKFDKESSPHHIIAGEDILSMDFISNYIAAINMNFKVAQIGHDRWCTSLVKTPLWYAVDMLPIGLGFAALSVPTQFLQSLITDNNLAVNHHQPLWRDFINAQIKRDHAGNVRPQIDENNKEPIDAVFASVMAVHLALNDTPERERRQAIDNLWQSIKESFPFKLWKKWKKLK